MLGGMSQSAHTPFTPAPSAPPAQLVSTRWLLALVTVSLGGYLLVLSLAGQFIQLFTGMRIELSYGVLLVLQLLFALAVVLLGLFFAPTSLARRSVAGAVVAVVVLLTIILQAVRLTTGLGAATVFIGFTFADAFVMLPLALGAAWLVVRARPGLAYAALALVVIPALVHWALARQRSRLGHHPDHHAHPGCARGGRHRLGRRDRRPRPGRVLRGTATAAAVRALHTAACPYRAE